MERNYLMLSLSDAFVNLSRHSRESGNPVDTKILAQRDKKGDVSATQNWSNCWIPAFAGMTIQ
jgi:hypothetical protein